MELSKTYAGTAVSEGYGIGRAVVIKEVKLDYSSVAFSDAETECKRLDCAVDSYTAETKRLIDTLKKEAGEKNAEILEGHLVMLADPFMIGQMKENIHAGMPAERAVDEVCSMFYQMFSATDDELTRQRATDVNDIKNSLLKILLGIEEVDISSVPKGSVLIATDFTPSMTSKINAENVEAIIGEVGGVTSHSAIIARAMGIPCVLGVADADNLFSSGESLIVDAVKGKIIAAPSDDELKKYSALKEQEKKERLLLKQYINKPTVTKSGIKKAVYANIAKAQDVHSAVVNGAEGIGLFRTEFLYMDRTEAPSEDEQFEAYKKVAEMLKGKPVIISTGIACEDEIHEAIAACHRQQNPHVALLKCTSAYPAPIEEANLRTLADMRSRFGVPVGISDHTLSSTVALTSVALGARIVEKHFILNRGIGGPDAAFSMEADEFRRMVATIRDVEKALGRVTYDLSPAVRRNRNFARSLFVVENLRAGDILTDKNVRSIRPADGLAPKYLPQILGHRVNRDIERGEPLKMEYID